MLEEKPFTMSQFLTQERRLEAKSEYYYMAAKRLDAELASEQAKNLQLCREIAELKRGSIDAREQINEECM